MKKIITFTYVFLFLIPQFANGKISEIVPCKVLYDLTPEVNKFHQDTLRKIFTDETKEYISKSTLIIYESPALDPESVLVLHKVNKSYQLELLQFDRSIWGEIHKQLKETGTTIPNDKNIKVKYNLNRKTAFIGNSTAIYVEQIVNEVFQTARMPTQEESKSSNTVFDSTIYTFDSKNGNCGMAVVNYEGKAGILLDVAMLLRQFVVSDNPDKAHLEEEITKITEELGLK